MATNNDLIDFLNDEDFFYPLGDELDPSSPIVGTNYTPVEFSSETPFPEKEFVGNFPSPLIPFLPNDNSTEPLISSSSSSSGLSLGSAQHQERQAANCNLPHSAQQIVPHTQPETIPEVVKTVYPNGNLYFANNSGFASICHPQVPKKYTLKLSGVPKTRPPPVLIIRVWAENPSAIKTTINGQHKCSIEQREKKREGSWAPAINTPFHFKINPATSEYEWTSFIQFTHLSHYEDEKRVSSGCLMLLFYVRGASPTSKEELLLKTPLITISRRHNKSTKVVATASIPARPASLIFDSVSDVELGREIKRRYSKNKNKKLKDIIGTLETVGSAVDVNVDAKNLRSGPLGPRGGPQSFMTGKRMKYTYSAEPAGSLPGVTPTPPQPSDTPAMFIADGYSSRSSSAGGSSTASASSKSRSSTSSADNNPPSSSPQERPTNQQLAIDWFNNVYPKELQLCSLATEMPLRDFNEKQRNTVCAIATLFDKLALVMAEVETLGEKGEN